MVELRQKEMKDHDHIDQIVVFYGSNSWAYTRLGHVELSQEEMEELLGNGDVELTLSMEN